MVVLVFAIGLVSGTLLTSWWFSIDEIGRNKEAKKAAEKEECLVEKAGVYITVVGIDFAEANEEYVIFENRKYIKAKKWSKS